MTDSLNKQLQNTGMLYQKSILTYDKFMLVVQKILELESPGVRFDEAYPNILLPTDQQFFFNNDNNLSDFKDTVTHHVVLQTPANMGGDKEPHGSPKLRKPRLEREFIDPEDSNNIIKSYRMFYDYTIQFDLFAHSYHHLWQMVDFFIDTMYQYRDFIKYLGTSEFLFQARFKDDLLKETFMKYHLPNTSIQYFIRLERVHLKQSKKYNKLLLTINKEMEIELGKNAKE